MAITIIRSYPDYSPTWPIFTYYDHHYHLFLPLTSKEQLQDIRSAVATIGHQVLGFGPSEVGNHSGRAATAMLLYLNKVPPYTIMLIGRWHSDAFLAYIEKQVREFTRGLSNIMLSLDSFYHLPDPNLPSQNTQTQDLSRRSAHFVHFGRLNALRSRFRL
jgi:hypothetical protein